MKLNRLWGSRDSECQRECSLWGCKYLGLFTGVFTPDLFLDSNDLNAFCFHFLHGNSLRKLDPSCVVTWFAGRPRCDSFNDSSILKPYWCDKMTKALLSGGLSFHLRLACLHFPQCVTAAWLSLQLTLLYYLTKELASHKISSIFWVISPLWYQLKLLKY